MSDSDQEQRQVAKISAMVKSIRQSSRGGNRQNVRDQIANQQQKVMESQIRITQAQLQKARQNTAMLMAKLGQREDQIQQLEMHIRQLTIKNEQMQEIHSHKPQKSFQGYKQLQLQCSKMQQDIQIKEKQIDRLKNRLLNSEQLISQSALQGQSRAILLLQIGQLRSAIQRLLYLLKLTSEFNSFINCIQDSGGAYYLKAICKRIKNNQIIMPRTLKTNGIKMCSCMDIKLDQKYIWAPLDAYRHLADIKRKYQTMDQDCIEQILFALNQIWSARQQSHINRIKQHYQAQIKKLKKSKAVPFDQMFAKKQISRLKKDVSKFRKQKSLHNPIKSYQLLKDNGKLQDQLKIKNRQINYLIQKIDKLQRQAGLIDKSYYMEGASWMGKRIMHQLYKHKQQFIAFQDDFCNRIDQLSRNDQTDWAKAYKWMFQGSQQLNTNLYEKVRMMQATAQSKAKK